MNLALHYAAFSHVGLLRTGNEDSGYGGPRLLAVADGMGGHAAGEVASAVAITSISELDEDAPDGDLLGALSRAATDANDHLRAMVAGDATLDGMGTTLTALLFSGGRLGLLHIGDSRCYLLRDGELNQITHDDTLVQSLVDDGRISEDEASTHPQRSLITRALDGRPDVDFDLSVREVRIGDRYLLCTDGLTGPVARRETLQQALEIASPSEAVERLVELALRGGGPDNVTVLVADVVGGSQADAPVVVGAAADKDSAGPTTTVLDTGAAGRAAAAAASVLPGPGPGYDSAGGVQEAGGVQGAGGVHEADGAPAPRRSRPSFARLGLVSVAVLTVLGAAGFGGYRFLQSQWYVGEQDGQVTVFRGVSGSIAGLELHRAQEPPTGVPAARLSEGDLDRLGSGIEAADRADAARIVSILAAQRAPVPTPVATPTTRPGPTAPAGPTATPGPTAGPR